MGGLAETAPAAAILYPDLCNDDAPRKILTDKISRGEFGIKTGKGFWEWSEAEAKAERKRYAKALKAALAILQEEETE